MAKQTIQYRKVDDLVPDPRNARTHDPDQVAQLEASIERFGWTNPILCDDMIRAGHGRRMAAQAIYARGGRIRLPSGDELPDGTVPVLDCTGWSEADKRAYVLADNQLALNAGWDEGVLAEELKALSEMEFPIELTGFSDADLDEMLARLNAESSAPGENQQDSNFTYSDQYGVIIICKDEAEQQAVYERMMAAHESEGMGLGVKVVTT